jgi:predicted permease
MSVMRRIGNLFTRGKVEREIDAELRAHIEMRTADNVARGMTAEEARRDALLKFGNPVVMKEKVAGMDVALWVENFWRDVRYAARQLKKSPGFAMTAILTLALGIGANTAIFSIVNSMLFASRHIQQENRLVALAFQQKGTSWSPNVSVPEFLDLRKQTKNVFSSVIGEQGGMDGLSMQGSKPARVFTDYVSGDYFQTLGIQPVLGRFFLPTEGETPGADPVIVLSYNYWKQHFGGDPHIVGRQVFLDGHPLTIIGVVPRNYHGITPVLTVQGYLPLAMIVTIENTPLNDWNKRANREINPYARLQPGITMQQANAALAVVARRFAAEDPGTEKDAKLRTFPFNITRTGFDLDNLMGTISALFLSLAGLVLLLACVNVANLLLVRASVREREMVIRSALGAQRSRLIRQMLTESILLALFGGAAGVALGVWASGLLGSINLHTDLPLSFNFGFDWHVFAFSAAIALFAGAVVGIVPALRLSRANLNLVLREGGRGITQGGNKFRDALVMVQVASALMLLIIAGLFTRSLAQAAHADLGFHPSHVLTLSMDTSEVRYSDAQSRDFYETMLARVRTLPGVVSATTAGAVPMSLVSNSGFDSLTIPGYQTAPGQSAPFIEYNLINTEYFRTLQIPLLQGRSFSDADDEQHLHVAIVSRAMAKKFWPNQNPIGKQFTMAADPKHPIQVVGIADDARYSGFTGAIDPLFYIPFLQHYVQNSLETLELRTAGDPVAMIPEVERTIRSIMPTLPVFEVKTLQEGLYSVNGLLVYRVAAAIAGVMGTLGLILAIIGVYGVLSYVVSQKTNEIGIRMALGAQRSDILKMVYRQGLWIVGIGLAVGLAATFAATHLMRSFIVVSATDPITYIGVSAILVAIALLACYIPARRAVGVDPMQALRSE